MSNNNQSNPFGLRDAFYAALHRDVLVYDLLDDALSELVLPSQGLRALCHDELSADDQSHMLLVVAKLVADAGMLEVFDVLVANAALARRDWSLLAELGIRGITHEEHLPHIFPEGSAVNRRTPSEYYARATWRFDTGKCIPRIHGEGPIEQLARHLTASLIEVAAGRQVEQGAER